MTTPTPVQIASSILSCWPNPIRLMAQQIIPTLGIVAVLAGLLIIALSQLLVNRKEKTLGKNAKLLRNGGIGLLFLGVLLLLVTFLLPLIFDWLGVPKCLSQTPY